MEQIELFRNQSSTSAIEVLETKFQLKKNCVVQLGIIEQVPTNLQWIINKRPKGFHNIWLV